LGQLTFFSIIGFALYGLDGLIDISGFLYDIAFIIAAILIILGTLMLLGWTSNALVSIQRIIDKYQNTENDNIFTPRRNMYVWGIGYSAASVDCTAAAVFPFMAWLITIGNGALISGMSGLIISVSFLMILVTILVSSGRQSIIKVLRSSTVIIKGIGSWMMIFAGIGLMIYLTQTEKIASLIG